MEKDNYCFLCGGPHENSSLNREETIVKPAKRLLDVLTGSARFHEILKELGALHDKKQKDYGSPDDPFANVRGSSDWDVLPWVGAMIRANDKIKRLQKYARDGVLENEGVEDSFKDLAVYAIIGLILWEEGKK